MARASILWLMGEYCEKVPKIAPDVLRKMAKTFTAEEDIVKLQTVNLAAKLYLTNSKQVQNKTCKEKSRLCECVCVTVYRALCANSCNSLLNTHFKYRAVKQF